jgi:hypothetical protein
MTNTNYRVSVLISNTPDFGSNSKGIYVQISARTATSFTITLRSNSDGGALNAPTGGVAFDWIAIADN